MFLSVDFEKCCTHLDLGALCHSSDVIYLVDHHLVIKGYNNAYLEFARNNNGDTTLTDYLEGVSIYEICEEPLGSFWTNAYHSAIEGNRVFEYEYLCPSPTQQRLYHQTAYPIQKKSGLVISNHLVKSYEVEMDQTYSYAELQDENGFIVQCQNCRKIRNPANQHQWVWVPSLIERMVPNMSHSICSCCMDHFYPDIRMS